MASAIDPTVIGAGNIDKASVRLQLERARDEITALQATRVLKTGDTMAGDLTISKTDPFLILNKSAAGQSNYIQGRQAGSARWGLSLGGPTTSDFAVDRYSDVAAYIDTPLSIARATGAPTFANASLWRSALGGSTVGIQVFTAATAADARTATNTPTNPTGVGGAVGEWRALSANTGLDLVMPAGGVWAGHAKVYDNSNVFSGVTVTAVAAGGTIISAGLAGFYHTGFCWRIS